MLHSFKKKVAKATAPTRGINPGGEFLDYRNRLATLKKSLQYIDGRMDQALKTWATQMIEQRTFSERFSASYPISGDETDKIAKEFSEGSQAVYDYFIRNTSPDNAKYHKMHAQVRAYIKEISDVEALYPKLLQAKSEAERYQSKVDSIERSSKTDDLKKTRNLQKLDFEKQKLEQTTTEVLTAQKQTYAKAPIIYKTALCAYWSAHERHTLVMMKSMEKTSQFAKDTELQLENIDISQLSVSTEAQPNPEAAKEKSEMYASSAMQSTTSNLPTESSWAARRLAPVESHVSFENDLRSAVRVDESVDDTQPTGEWRMSNELGEIEGGRERTASEAAIEERLKSFDETVSKEKRITYSSSEDTIGHKDAPDYPEYLSASDSPKRASMSEPEGMAHVEAFPRYPAAIDSPKRKTPLLA